jgi:hypothetical protein
MAKKRPKSRRHSTKVNGKANGAKESGKTNGHHAGGRVQTVTFRIPVQLKKSVEQSARSRGMTTTRFVVEALENEVNDKPPRWWREQGEGERPRA